MAVNEVNIGLYKYTINQGILTNMHQKYKN